VSEEAEDFEEEFLREFLVIFEEVTGGSSPAGLFLEFQLRELNIDSLTRIELVASLEDRLGVTIGDSVLRSAVTVRDLLLGSVAEQSG
jgi:acyl carrier protein